MSKEQKTVIARLFDKSGDLRYEIENQCDVDVTEAEARKHYREQARFIDWRLFGEGNASVEIEFPE